MKRMEMSGVGWGGWMGLGEKDGDRWDWMGEDRDGGGGGLDGWVDWREWGNGEMKREVR